MKIDTNVWKGATLVLLGILIGCEAAAVQSANANPPSGGSAPPGTRTWAHVCDRAENFATLNQVIDRRGGAGWELTSSVATGTDGYVTCFKRPTVSQVKD